MRLTDLAPEWIDAGGRRGLGVKFRCMTGHCLGKVWVLFANPLDGGPAYEGECFTMILDFYDARDRPHEPIIDRPCGRVRWKRKGENFGELSMTPSVNAHECGHLTLTNGIFT